MDIQVRDEIVKQSNLGLEKLKQIYSGDNGASMKSAIVKLGGLPFDTLNNIANSVKPSSATLELIQTLKIMGYKIVLVSQAFSCLTDFLKTKLGLDYSYGFNLQIDSDSRSIVGDMNPVQFNASLENLNKDKILKELIKLEGISSEDIVVIDDKDVNNAAVPGFNLEFDMKMVLDYMNQRILSKDNLLGVLGSFGIPSNLK